MNNKTKGILMLIPVISILITIFIIEPIFILIFGFGVALGILVCMTTTGLNLLYLDKKEE